jgi:hypothetical protein
VQADNCFRRNINHNLHRGGMRNEQLRYLQRLFRSRYHKIVESRPPAPGRAWLEAQR